MKRTISSGKENTKPSFSQERMLGVSASWWKQFPFFFLSMNVRRCLKKKCPWVGKFSKCRAVLLIPTPFHQNWCEKRWKLIKYRNICGTCRKSYQTFCTRPETDGHPPPGTNASTKSRCRLLSSCATSTDPRVEVNFSRHKSRAETYIWKNVTSFCRNKIHQDSKFINLIW